ncbi:MAG: hypothetical protein LBS43_01465 [Prevotellaceae bacterium]|jgi:hypothetical protein|nr:hypothetical protein [Prevotellaceae bacterium]
MKKKIIFLMILTIPYTVYAQNSDFQTLLDSAKLEFFNEDADYYRAASLLEQAVLLRPRDAETRYFLGYAYSRINSRDGENIVDMSWNLTVKTSEQFEKVNQLSPRYTGEMILLDPYSKLSSEWASLAMNYLYKSQPDSALMALYEGKQRGGFNDFTLSLNRKILDRCNKNAILISAGDRFTMPIQYLQTVENYRTDVAVVDVFLLASQWYPPFLAARKTVEFDMPAEALDTVGVRLWTDRTVSINNFSWTLKPSYYRTYSFLVRNDLLLLSILQKNKFKRDIYFVPGFPSERLLSLDNYLTSLFIVNKLTVKNNLNLSFDEYKQLLISALQDVNKINANSSDELRLLDFLRVNICNTLHKNHYFDPDNIAKGKELIKLMKNLANEQYYPILLEDLKNYLDMFE